jgi:hypothetical protein
MWFVVVALVSVVSSLIFGRVLARAAAHQTHDPRRVRGPAVESGIEANRLAIAENAKLIKQLEASVHLN